MARDGKTLARIAKEAEIEAAEPEDGVFITSSGGKELDLDPYYQDTKEEGNEVVSD